MNQEKNIFSDYMNALRFIASSVTIYGISNGKLSETKSDDQFLAFFSRGFLQKRRWTIIPLWEGDLRFLQLEDGRRIEFLTEIRSFCLQRKSRYMHVAAIEKIQWEYAPDFSALTIAARKLDLSMDHPNTLFETTPANLPYWGANFFWPDDEHFMIYTDGDNVSFIAGDRKEIEEFLGVSHRYCMERFVSANIANQTRPELIEAFKQFCEDFVTIDS